MRGSVGVRDAWRPMIGSRYVVSIVGEAAERRVNFPLVFTTDRFVHVILSRLVN